MLSVGTRASVPALLATSMGHRAGSVSPDSQYSWVPSPAYGVCLSLISPPNRVFLGDADRVLNVPGGRVTTRTQGSACPPPPGKAGHICSSEPLALHPQRERDP